MGLWAKAEYDIAAVVRQEMDVGMTAPMYNHRPKEPVKSHTGWWLLTTSSPNKNEVYEVSKQKQHRPLFSMFKVTPGETSGTWFGICESPEAAFKSTTPSKDMTNGTAVAWRARVGIPALWLFPNPPLTATLKTLKSPPGLPEGPWGYDHEISPSIAEDWIPISETPTQAGIYEVLHNDKKRVHFTKFSGWLNKPIWGQVSPIIQVARDYGFLESQGIKNNKYPFYRKIPGEIYGELVPKKVVAVPNPTTKVLAPNILNYMSKVPPRDGLYEIGLRLNGETRMSFSLFKDGNWHVSNVHRGIAVAQTKKSEWAYNGTFTGWRDILSIR